MNLPNNITGVQLTSRWWKQPPDWFCIVCRVDDDFARVAPFSAEAPSSAGALEAALALAAAHKFSEGYVRPGLIKSNLDLDLEIDL